MRKFIIQSKKGLTSIIEVDIEIVKPIDEPSVMWLNTGEYKAAVLAPTSFHQKFEKQVNGKTEIVLKPDVWCWFEFFDTVADAEIKTLDLIINSFQFELRKYGTAYSQKDIEEAIKAIKIIFL